MKRLAKLSFIVSILFSQNACFAAGINSSSMLFKFFGAMFGVVASALAIFLGLKFYQKFVKKNNSKFDNFNFSDTLQAPKDLKEAINQFLDKTES